MPIELMKWTDEENGKFDAVGASLRLQSAGMTLEVHLVGAEPNKWEWSIRPHSTSAFAGTAGHAESRSKAKQLARIAALQILNVAVVQLGGCQVRDEITGDAVGFPRFSEAAK
jgi:hypothetical protein